MPGQGGAVAAVGLVPRIAAPPGRTEHQGAVVPADHVEVVQPPAERQIEAAPGDVGDPEQAPVPPAAGDIGLPRHGGIVEGVGEDVRRARPLAQVPAIQGQIAAVEAFLLLPAIDPQAGAQQGVGLHLPVAALHVPAQPTLHHPGVIVRREAVGDETLVLQVVIEQLQLQGLSLGQVLVQVPVEGGGVGAGKVRRADEHRPRAQAHRLHAAGQLEARVRGRGEAEIGRDQPGPRIGARIGLRMPQAAVAIGVHQDGVAPGLIGAVVDQGLGDPVPARRLHIAVRVIDHAAEGRAPAPAQVQVGGQLAQLMAGIDAVIVAVAVVHLGIGEHTPLGGAQLHRRAQIGGQALVVIAAALDLHVPGGPVEEAVLPPGRLRGEVQEAPDLARSHGGRGRAPHHLDPVRGPQGRGIGAPVLDPLEAAEIGLRQRAAQVHRPGDPVIAVGEGPRCHGHQIVDALHAIALQRLGAGEAGLAAGVQEGLVETEDRGVGLTLQQAGGILRRHGHRLHGGRRDLGRRRREGQSRNGRRQEQNTHHFTPHQILTQINASRLGDIGQHPQRTTK